MLIKAAAVAAAVIAIGLAIKKSKVCAVIQVLMTNTMMFYQ